MFISLFLFSLKCKRDYLFDSNNNNDVLNTKYRFVSSRIKIIQMAHQGHALQGQFTSQNTIMSIEEERKNAF